MRDNQVQTQEQRAEQPNAAPPTQLKKFAARYSLTSPGGRTRPIEEVFMAESQQAAERELLDSYRIYTVTELVLTEVE